MTVLGIDCPDFDTMPHWLRPPAALLAWSLAISAFCLLATIWITAIGFLGILKPVTAFCEKAMLFCRKYTGN